MVIPDLDVPPDEWVKELINRHPKPTEAYQIDPKTINDIVTGGTIWDEVVIWHTHPNGSVGPSRGDLEYAVDGLKYVVVSLPRGEAARFGSGW